MAQDTAKHIYIKSTDTIPRAKKIRNNSPKAHKKETIRKDTTRIVKVPKYQRDGYIAIMYGIGIPNNSFASGGNAANGKVFSISAAFPGIISHGGIALKFDHGINGFNETGLVQSLNNQIGFSNINCSLTGSVGQYSYSTLLSGLYLTYPSKHITIDARILVGVMFAIEPAFSANYTDQASGNTGTFTQAEALGNAFAFDMGIEVRYPVLHKFCIFLSADYLTSSPSFNNITTGAALNSTGNIVHEIGRETTAGQSFDLSNFSLGIGYIISAQKRSVPKPN